MRRKDQQKGPKKLSVAEQAKEDVNAAAMAKKGDLIIKYAQPC